MELTVDRIAVGGKGLGLDGDGRATFVAGSVPTERVRVELTTRKKRFAEGSVVAVLDPSPDRVLPPCPHAAGTVRCGGCDWQHISVDAQPGLRVAMVEDALRRIGKIDTSELEIVSADPLPARAYRTGVRMLVDAEGHLAYRQPRSHEPFAPITCPVADPGIDDLIQNTSFTGCTEVSIRVSGNTGERMVTVKGPAAGLDLPDDVTIGGSITEKVDGVELRVSSGAFFQSSPAGAEQLVALVRKALAGVDRTGTLIDAYAGGGLFAATVGSEWTDAGGSVFAVESNGTAVEDARVNAPAATIVKKRFEDWEPVAADALVADPARTGLEAGGVATVVATGAPVVVLISCDAGSLGRDAGLLIAEGYRITDVTVVDMFNQTSHVEVVTRFFLPAARL